MGDIPELLPIGVDQAKKAVEVGYERLVDLAMSTVRTMVERHMGLNPDIRSFYMSMGSWWFHLSDGVEREIDGEVYDFSGAQITGSSTGRDLVDDWYCDALDDFIDEWDQILHLTGNPLRIDNVEGNLVVTTGW